VIVAVTHLNITEDIQLARDVDGIHLILGGHEHIPIQFLIGSTLILKAGTDAQYLGVVDLAVDKRGDRVAVVPSWSVVAVRGLPPDPAVKAVVDRYVAMMEKQLGGVIGRTETELDSRTSAVRTGEAAIGNLIADAIMGATGADAALMNGGGIRGNTVYSAGQELTAKDILTELPFNNAVVVLGATGKDILAALEHGLSEYGSEQGRFPQIAGMVVRFDPTRPAGQRVTAATIAGAPLDPGRTYKLATNDFVAGGGDGYAMFRDLPRVVNESNGPAITNTVIDYLKARKTVAPKVEGRIEAVR
jgi:2',3'-cyclic-nucleotide 2'-phosphodiesterase (5'-nucleotidase family)